MLLERKPAAASPAVVASLRNNAASRAARRAATAFVNAPNSERMISLVIVPALLLAAEQPPPTSMLPLSDQLLLKHFGESAPPANSGYGTERRRRRMTELTAETTDRIRIHVDYASLYEETAPLYSACFQVGAWYARGLAGPRPPADGVATCRGETSDQDCWGKCAADDIIEAVGRDQVKAVVDLVVKEVEGQPHAQPHPRPQPPSPNPQPHPNRTPTPRLHHARLLLLDPLGRGPHL